MNIGLGANFNQQNNDMKSVKCGEVWEAIDELLKETDFVNKAYAKLARLHGVTNQELIDKAKIDYEITTYLRHEIADGFNTALLNAEYKLKYGKVH